MMQPGEATDQLIAFCSQLTYDAIPQPVIERTQDLLIDWMGAALAGRSSRAVHVFERFANTMGPTSGASQTVTGQFRGTSPFFAALVNGAASHVVEQDDVHNGAVFHPGTVVIPSALAMAQAQGASGSTLLLSIVVGYEVGVRIGRFLGQSHYKTFHTTGTAGTLASAAAGARILQLNAEGFRQAVGSAGTQAAGLWEFLRDAADSKQLHTAKAASDGLLAAYAADWGLTAARQILEGEQAMGRGMSSNVHPDALIHGLGERWAILETSLKWHASCRHTHPSADALHHVIKTYNIQPQSIEAVTAHVHRAAIDVLGPARAAATPHQAKFSMPFVLSLIALRGHASIDDFNDVSLHDPQIRAFMERVTMVEDAEVEAAYPERWIGKVTVKTTEGSVVKGHIDAPLGDPDNFLSRDQIREKALRIAHFGDCPPHVVGPAIQRILQLEHLDTVPWLWQS